MPKKQGSKELQNSAAMTTKYPCLMLPLASNQSEILNLRFLWVEGRKGGIMILSHTGILTTFTHHRDFWLL